MHLSHQPGQIAPPGNMHNQRIVGRPALGGKDSLYRSCAGGIRPQPVHRLRRERDGASFPQQSCRLCNGLPVTFTLRIECGIRTRFFCW
ncbi:hypothetical protein D3C73_1296390 [compost metagenome]